MHGEYVNVKDSWTPRTGVSPGVGRADSQQEHELRLGLLPSLPTGVAALSRVFCSHIFFPGRVEHMDSKCNTPPPGQMLSPQRSHQVGASARHPAPGTPAKCSGIPALTVAAQPCGSGLWPVASTLHGAGPR